MSEKEQVDFDISCIDPNAWLIIVNSREGIALSQESMQVLAKRIKLANPEAEIVFLSDGLTVEGLGDDSLAFLGLVRADTGVEKNEFALRGCIIRLMEELGRLRKIFEMPDELVDALLTSQVDVCEFADFIIGVVEGWCQWIEKGELEGSESVRSTEKVRDLVAEIVAIRTHIALSDDSPSC